MIQLDPTATLRILQNAVALFVNGHFVARNGDHVTTYLDEHAIIGDPETLLLLRGGIAQLLSPFNVEVIAALPGPEATLGRRVASCLGRPFVVLTPSDDDEVDFLDSASAQVAAGANLGLVTCMVRDEPLLRTAATFLNSHGELVGIGGVWHAGDCVSRTFGDLPDRSLVTLIGELVPTWTEEKCGIEGPCSQGVPIRLQPGHGHLFVEKTASSEQSTRTITASSVLT